MIGLQCLCYLCGKLWVGIRPYYLHVTFQKIPLLVNASTFNPKDQSFYIGQFGIALNMQREYFMQYFLGSFLFQFVEGESLTNEIVILLLSYHFTSRYIKNSFFFVVALKSCVLVVDDLTFSHPKLA